MTCFLHCMNSAAPVVAFLHPSSLRCTSHFQTPVVRDGRIGYRRQTIVCGFSRHLIGPNRHIKKTTLSQQADAFTIIVFMQRPLSVHCSSRSREATTSNSPSQYTVQISHSQLSIPRTKLNLGKRAFSVAAPIIWNELPTTLKSCESHASFRKHLKTYLFKIAFPP